MRIHSEATVKRTYQAPDVTYIQLFDIRNFHLTRERASLVYIGMFKDTAVIVLPLR